MKRFLRVMAVALGSVIAHAQLPGDIIRAQVPEIHEIVPATPEAGQVVRIFGQNFDRTPTNNTVHFGGANARVLRSWVSELEVEVPRSIQPGSVTVVVSNKIAMSQVPFQARFAPFGQTNPIYTWTLSFEGARHPAAVDLDNDGDLELVLARQPDKIEVYKYTGSGPLLSSNSFTLVSTLSGCTNTASIRAMDRNGDGKYDLLVSSTNFGARIIANIHRDGDLGTNSLSFSLPAPASPIDFFDVDRDGTLDLITTNIGGVYAHRGVPAGGHEAYYGPTPISVDRRITSAAVADLNRDGHADVVTLNGQQMTIHSHDGRMGIFGTFIEFSLPAQSLAALQIADIEGDGWLDILVFNRSTRLCEVYWNRNIGGHLSADDFTRIVLAPQEISTLIMPRLADIDGDSFPDLITRSLVYHKNESQLLGNIVFSGTFAPTNWFGVSYSSPTSFIIADLNADGDPEVITDEAEIYQNVTAIAPLITGVRPSLTPGELFFEIVGHGGQNVSIQRSEDLNTWSAFQTLKLAPNGRNSWPVPSNGDAAFFRVFR